MNPRRGQSDRAWRCGCCALPIAVEVLFSRDDMGNGAQTTAIARRIAYLTCQGGCGRTAPHCPYTEARKGRKALVTDLRTLAGRGQGWQCSAFLDVSAPDEAVPALQYPPLFNVRNEIAHRGDAALTDRDLPHLIWSPTRRSRPGLPGTSLTPIETWRPHPANNDRFRTSLDRVHDAQTCKFLAP